MHALVQPFLSPASDFQLSVTVCHCFVHYDVVCCAYWYTLLVVSTRQFVTLHALKIGDPTHCMFRLLPCCLVAWPLCYVCKCLCAHPTPLTTEEAWCVMQSECWKITVCLACGALPAFDAVVVHQGMTV
jgi:hypothetical protein